MRTHLRGKSSAVKYALSFCLLAMTGPQVASAADSAIAKKWIEHEFSPSTLTKQQQMDEMAWFAKAAEPYKGMSIRVVSERIDTHWYEASVLAKAFTEITGIRVIHELTGEDDLVKKLQTQMRTGENLYDGYINDSDLIGTHYRYQAVVPISDFLEEQDSPIVLPTLDIDDFIGLSFVTGPDGIIYQLPDQQFANLYWYRHDWFSRPDLQAKFKAQYGYPLAVPKNWTAYEDIDNQASDIRQPRDGSTRA